MDAIERALEILGLAPDATPKDVKQAYRDMTKVWHPDRFPNDSRVRGKAEEKLKEINGAYEILRGYDPASRVRSRPHGGPSARPNPAQNHQRAEAPKQGSSSPPFGPSGKKKPASPAPESRSGVPPWAYIIGAILAILLVRYFMEAPKTETRPRPPDVTYAPSIPTPSPAPETRERTSPLAPKPAKSRKEPALVTAEITMEKGGIIKIDFFPDDAPNTVDNFITLAEKGFYDGLTFHRVEPNFVVQGGDPKGDGTGGPGYKVKAEFNKQQHVRGAVAMARGQDPDSAGSQFYITLAPAHFLDGRYTVFGKVTSGMNIVDNIKNGDKMTSVRIVEIRGSTAPSATPPAPPPAQDRKEEKERLVANARRDIRRYRDTLGPVLQMYERELARQIELHKAQKDLYEKGAISAAEVRAGERALAAAQKDVDDTRRDIEKADRMMGEIELAPQGAEGKPRVPR